MKSAPNFKESLAHLPPQILYELARNESALLSARVASVELLLEGGHKEAKKPDIEALVAAVIANWKEEQINHSEEKADESDEHAALRS